MKVGPHSIDIDMLDKEQWNREKMGEEYLQSISRGEKRDYMRKVNENIKNNLTLLG